MALPPQLFFTTGIPVCLWFLTRDKTGKNLPRGGRTGGRTGETLFIDARKLGTMQTRWAAWAPPDAVSRRRTRRRSARSTWTRRNGSIRPWARRR